MIKNERAYKITRAAAEKFERALAAHNSEAIGASTGEVSGLAELSALRAQLTDLLKELADYEQLKAGRVRHLRGAAVEDLPALLIRARIVEGLTHERLAERLGVKPQQLQRWEDNDYQTAAFWRLIEVAEALGLSVSIRASVPERPGAKSRTEVLGNSLTQNDKTWKLGLSHTFDPSYTERGILPPFDYINGHAVVSA